MQVAIYHQRDKSRFYAKVRGQEAYMKYARPDLETIEIQSTFIPTALRGLGLAKRIAEFACAYVQNKQLKLKPSCPYLARLLENEPICFKQIRLAQQ